MDVIRQIADNVRVHRFERETIMLGQDFSSVDAALFPHIAGVQQADLVRIAHFAQFKHGRLRSIRAVLDTFDLVEQALGRSIHLPKMIA